MVIKKINEETGDINQILGRANVFTKDLDDADLELERELNKEFENLYIDDE